ncbi:hypothetical protein J3998_08260 [Thiomicrorhabdus sp. 6S2-11]|uniref:Zinc ribbon domain-containing protein n=1 Tax=Thiomicrorhabdus marina TaxID=2818442 RepID=A0ABS3Q5L1_9GAMM|nr:hypothetical protein [Thiomicrorhabdus marina]MBO1927571.1 hypothetical protein [Thiomicrorhabdus marina]
MSLKSRCNTCGAALSVSAQTCTHCGDTNPFLKNKILSINPALTIIGALPLLGLPVIFFITLGFALEYKSWGIVITGAVGAVIWYFGLFHSLGRDKLSAMRKVVLPSFSNFVKETKPGYRDEHGFWRELGEDDFLQAWEAYQLKLIGKPLTIHSESFGDSLNAELRDIYRKSLKET